MKIVFYTKPNRRSPVHNFIIKLPTKDRAKLFACLKSIEELGFDSPRVQFRQIKETLWEIKITSFRIFYVTVCPKIIVLLHAFKKQSQKAPKKEIQTAEKRMIKVLNDETYYIK